MLKMSYNYISLSFLLFYVFHLLVIVINGQQHLQQPQPLPSHIPRQFYGHHKVTTSNGLQYQRSYNLNNTGFSEHIYMSPNVYERSTNQPINRQTRNIQGYSLDSERDVGADQEFPRYLRNRGLTSQPVLRSQLMPQMLPQPQLPPQFSQLPPQFPSRLPLQMPRPVTSPVVPPLASPNIPRYGPVMPQNQYNERAQYRSDYSSNFKRQTVSGNEVTVPHSYTVRDEPMNRVIDYFSTDSFKKYQQENKLGTVSLFKNIIIGANSTADEAILRANSEKTGHNFNNGTSDCKPMLTVVKFGNINQPEIIYNPSSVQVLRCPQACFSWQFDCIPVKKISHNFTVAVYTMEKDKVTREVNQFEVISHNECECRCKAFASCLSSPSMSPKRPKSNF